MFGIVPIYVFKDHDGDKITEGVKLNVKIGPDIKYVRFFKKYNFRVNLYIFVLRLLYDYVVCDHEDSEIWKEI